MLKVVIDTNLLIDGFVDDFSFANRIIDEVINKKILAFANRATFNEYALIANQKITDLGYLNRLNNYFNAVKIVTNKNRISICEDPEDNKLLEAAHASEADFLITSDKHLLKIERYGGTKIFKPSQFLDYYNEESGNLWKDWLKIFIKS